MASLSYLREEIGTALRASTSQAETRTMCRRRGCGVSLFDMRTLSIVAFATNGSPNWRCNGIKGACGCPHAEVKLIRRVQELTQLRIAHRLKQTDGSLVEPLGLQDKLVLLSTLAPCRNCAHVIGQSMLVVVGAVVYQRKLKHDTLGLDILNSYGLEATHLDEL